MDTISSFTLLKNIKKPQEAKIILKFIRFDTLESFKTFFSWKKSRKEDKTRSQKVHQVFCVSFSITGSLTNFLLTLIVIYRSLFRQSRFAFFSLTFWFAFSWWVLYVNLFGQYSLRFFPWSCNGILNPLSCSRIRYVYHWRHSTLLHSFTLCESLHLCRKKYIVWSDVFHQKYPIMMNVKWLLCPILLLFPLLYVWSD